MLISKLLFSHIFRSKKRRGVCKTPTPCFNGMIFWPLDSKCYTLHTKGPCSKGKLIVQGKNRIAECKVHKKLAFKIATKTIQPVSLFSVKTMEN